MSNLFDELRSKLENDAGRTGISAWELAQLPAAQRQIIRLLLREVQMADLDLRRALASLAGEQQPDPRELDEALARLIEQAWLIRLGQDQRISYRVNLRRKAGSRLGASIWERLDRHIGQSAPSGGEP